MLSGIPAFPLKETVAVDEYRLLITGSRFLSDRSLVRERLGFKLEVAIALGKQLVIVHGDCPDHKGADKTADIWGTEQSHMGMPVRVERHPAQNHPTQDFGPWPGAGPNRNDYLVGLGANEGIAFIDKCTSMRCRRPDVHPSHGTLDCLRKAEAAGIPMERVEMWRAS